MTGFGPFVTESGAAVLVNPSDAIARRAAERLGASIAILPVGYAVTPGAFRDALIAARPRTWVGVGLAASRRVVSVEAIALNTEHGRDAGERWDAAIEEDGPVARRVRFDAAGFVRRGRAAGWPIELSHHAGTYLCNRVLYDGLVECERGGLAQAAFVHVPPAELVSIEEAAAVVVRLAEHLHGSA